MSSSNMKISIVCPMYNEEESLASFFPILTQQLDQVTTEYEIICINDGSSDDTLKQLEQFKLSFPKIRIINLSRNFGKESALTAGLAVSKGDVVIPIDADLQDPPELIIEMIKQYELGYDVVLARRCDRSNDSTFKRLSASYFYKIIRLISHVDIPQNVGDFRLMSRRVVDVLNNLPETQRFMKGVFAWAGFPTTVIEYQRPERNEGTTSFNGWKLWNLALEGITSFSTVPLRVWTYLGLIVALLSFIYGSITIIKTIVLGVDVPGYASLLTVTLFIGGIQLIGIGVIGEYIGRIYLESKKRPSYVIESER